VSVIDFLAGDGLVVLPNPNFTGAVVVVTEEAPKENAGVAVVELCDETGDADVVEVVVGLNPKENEPVDPVPDAEVTGADPNTNPLFDDELEDEEEVEGALPEAPVNPNLKLETGATLGTEVMDPDDEVITGFGFFSEQHTHSFAVGSFGTMHTGHSHL
jgi:hypothetical protein